MGRRTEGKSDAENLRIAELSAQDVKIENGKIIGYRTKLRLSFKFRDG